VVAARSARRPMPEWLCGEGARSAPRFVEGPGAGDLGLLRDDLEAHDSAGVIEFS
jgi:hypothetical protein